MLAVSISHSLRRLSINAPTLTIDGDNSKLYRTVNRPQSLNKLVLLLVVGMKHETIIGSSYLAPVIGDLYYQDMY